MGISEDATNTPAVKYSRGTSATQVTASFSPAAGTLVVVQVSLGFSTASSSVPAIVVTDSLSNTYTPGPNVYSTRADYAGIFTFYYTSAPGSITVTATRSLTAAAAFQVAARCTLGAASDQTGAASGTYFAPQASKSLAVNGALVTTVTGSQVYVCGTINNSQATSPVAGTTTILATQDSTDSESVLSGKATALTGTPGSTTFGWTTTPTVTFALALLEVVPVASAPAPATLAVTTSIPVPGVHAYPAISSLTDTFLGTTLNTALWTAYPDGLSGSVAVSNGLYLTDTSNVAAADSILSNSLYDLTNSAVYAQLVSAGAQGGAHQALLQATAAGNNSLNIQVSNGFLIAQDQVNGAWTQQASVTYNSTAMQWFRIRETSGTVYYEYAATPAGAWTVLYSEADPVLLTAVQVVVMQNAWSTGDPAATSHWANLNIPNASPATLVCTTAFPAPAVCPITNAGDSAGVTGASSTLVCTYSTTAGNTLIAWITAYVLSNNAITMTSLTDSAGNTWTVIPGAGSWNSPGAVYGYCALAFCVNAAAVTSVTARFSRSPSNSGLRISQFSGVPAGYILAAAQASAASGAHTSFSTPTISVPAVPAIVFGATAASGSTTWTAVSPGTLPAGGHVMVRNIVTSPGTQAFTFSTSGAAVSVEASITAAIGPPAVVTTAYPGSLIVTASFPAPAVAGFPVTPSAVTVTTSIPRAAVSPAQIFHVGDSAPYTGSDYSAIVAYTNIAGNTLVAYITVYNTGNNPGTITGVFDDVANTWTVAQGGGSYDATTGLYGYTAIACCVSAIAMNYITVYYSDMLHINHANIQISEFAGIPAGSTPAAIAVDSPDTSTASYVAPAVTVPAGAYLILSAVASSGTWTGVSPGTVIDSTQASWNIVTGSGSYAPACTGSAQTVYGAVTLALGSATPTTPALFTPVGSWIGANSTPLAAQLQAAGNLIIVKVTNTDNSTVYCTGLTSSNATWTPAGTPFFGVVNAMTAAAFIGTVITAGADTIVPTWSGAVPASWTMAGHEFFAAAGWEFDTQAGLDSTGTDTWPAATPSSGNGELYFGHASAGSPSAGSTPGFVYNIDVGGSRASAAYNSAATP